MCAMQQTFTMQKLLATSSHVMNGSTQVNADQRPFGAFLKENSDKKNVLGKKTAKRVAYP